ERPGTRVTKTTDRSLEIAVIRQKTDFGMKKERLMTQNGNQNRKRPILRLTALLVALAILSTAVITQFDTISRIAAVFAEEDPLARIYSILQDEIDEPQTYEDY